MFRHEDKIKLKNIALKEDIASLRAAKRLAVSELEGWHCESRSLIASIANLGLVRQEAEQLDIDLLLQRVIINVRMHRVEYMVSVSKNKVFFCTIG